MTLTHSPFSRLNPMRYTVSTKLESCPMSDSTRLPRQVIRLVRLKLEYFPNGFTRLISMKSRITRLGFSVQTRVSPWVYSTRLSNQDTTNLIHFDQTPPSEFFVQFLYHLILQRGLFAITWWKFLLITICCWNYTWQLTVPWKSESQAPSTFVLIPNSHQKFKIQPGIH